MKARRVVVVVGTDAYEDSLKRILSDGKMYERPDFILDSLWCSWGYILNLDAEVFEIYEGDQLVAHNKGRYCDKESSYINHRHWLPNQYEAGKFVRYYPCALITSIPLIELPNFDLNTYWVSDD